MIPFPLQSHTTGVACPTWELQFVHSAKVVQPSPSASPQTTGVGRKVLVGVRVGVLVGVFVGVLVGVDVGVCVGVNVVQLVRRPVQFAL